MKARSFRFRVPESFIALSFAVVFLIADFGLNARGDGSSQSGSPTPKKFIVSPSSGPSPISAALKVAHDGDTLFLQPGVYNEQIEIKKNVRIIGPTLAPVTLSLSSSSGSGSQMTEQNTAIIDPLMPFPPKGLSWTKVTSETKVSYSSGKDIHVNDTLAGKDNSLFTNPFKNCSDKCPYYVEFPLDKDPAQQRPFNLSLQTAGELTEASVLAELNDSQFFNVVARPSDPPGTHPDSGNSSNQYYPGGVSQDPTWAPIEYSTLGVNAKNDLPWKFSDGSIWPWMMNSWHWQNLLMNGLPGSGFEKIRALWLYRKEGQFGRVYLHITGTENGFSPDPNKHKFGVVYNSNPTVKITAQESKGVRASIENLRVHHGYVGVQFSGGAKGAQIVNSEIAYWDKMGVSVSATVDEAKASLHPDSNQVIKNTIFRGSYESLAPTPEGDAGTDYEVWLTHKIGGFWDKVGINLERPGSGNEISYNHIYETFDGIDLGVTDSCILGSHAKDNPDFLSKNPPFTGQSGDPIQDPRDGN